MNRKYREESEESEEPNNLDSLEAYINASEFYIEALKLSGENAGYTVGMTAVYFGKAYLEIIDSDNADAIKGSLKEALNAYSTAVTFCESNNIAKQFIYTSRLIIAGMRTELKNM